MHGFANRTEGGRQLADALREYAGRDDVVVLALPRGGVVTAAEVARRLGAPLDVFVVRKLGVPGQPELAMGAIASGGIRVMNASVVQGLRLSDDAVDRVAAEEQEELERRERAYRPEGQPPALQGRTVILVDDGIATGATMRAAVQAVRSSDPARLIVAVPVAPPDSCEDLRQEADEVVALMTPVSFGGVGAWYRDFRQVTDDQVREILAEVRTGNAAEPAGREAAGTGESSTER
jgi:predicted phosphoribosyltransferase